MMSGEGEFLLLGGHTPVRGALEFSTKLALASSREVTLWQVVSVETEFLWIVPRSMPSSDEISALAAGCGIAVTQKYTLNLLQEWENRASMHPPVANFVMRIVAPGSVDRVLPQIGGQMENVLQQPGCQQCTLASVVGQPFSLLGVTYWADLETFQAYKNWASAHPWRDVINPVTLDVPLRALTTRLE